MVNTLAVIVKDEPGVLVRVAGVFSRHKLNINGLVVGSEEEPGLSHITITSECDQATFDLITKQVSKLIDVLAVTKRSS